MQYSHLWKWSIIFCCQVLTLKLHFLKVFCWSIFNYLNNLVQFNCLEPLKSTVECWMRKFFNFPLNPFNDLKKPLTIFTSDRHEQQRHIYFPCFLLSLPVLGGLFLRWKKEWLGAGLSFTSNTFTCLHAFINAILQNIISLLLIIW